MAQNHSWTNRWEADIVRPDPQPGYPFAGYDRLGRFWWGPPIAVATSPTGADAKRNGGE